MSTHFNSPARRRCKPPRARGICIYTQKQKYTKDDARTKSRLKRRREHTNHAEYFCSHCRMFHIGTSIKGKK